jgi:hypothetical protein
MQTPQIGNATQEAAQLNRNRSTPTAGAAATSGRFAASSALSCHKLLGKPLGKPLGEPAPVEVPASELTVAAGNLLQRGHHRAHTAAMLRRGCASRIAGLLGLARTSTPEDVARALIGRGADEDETLLVLCGPPPLTDRDLVVLAQHLDVMQARVDGALAGSLAPAAAGPTHTADAAPIPLSTQSAETAP